MPLLPGQIPFEQLLNQAGLQQIKQQIDQAIANPQITAKLLFEHFKDGAGLPRELPVILEHIGNEYTIRWTPPAIPADAIFFINSLPSHFQQLRIRIADDLSNLNEFLFEAESTINAFRDRVSDELTKIPFRLSMENNGGQNVFRVTQTAVVEAKIQGVLVTLKSTLLEITQTIISHFSLEAEIQMPGLRNAADTGPHIALVSFTYAANRFTASATNLPPAKMQGLDLHINQLNLILENGQFQAGTLVNGHLQFAFLDAINGQPGQINIAVTLENNGDVLYEAQNPEGQPLKKGAFTLFFQQIRIQTRTQGATDVAINGWLELEGLKNGSNGQAIQTSFDFEYQNSKYEFTGKNFVPIPIQFGSIEFQQVFLRMAGNGTMENAEVEGLLSLPLFSGGGLSFEVAFDNQNDLFTIVAANTNDTVLTYGDFLLVVKPFSLVYQSGQLQNIAGQGDLSIPLITSSNEPMGVELDFMRSGATETLLINITDFKTPNLAGCQLAFDTGRFEFINGAFSSLDMKGLLQLPDSTGGVGIAFTLAIENNGNDYRLTLNTAGGASRIDFGPLAFEIAAFEALVQAGQLQHLTGSGEMTLPGLQQAFPFSFAVDVAQNPPLYTFTINNFAAQIGGFELSVLHFHLTTQAGHQFVLQSNGKLKLPVFSGGNGIDFALEADRQDGYNLTTTANGEFISFGSFELSQVDVSVAVQSGIIQNFNGEADLKLPGLTAPTRVGISYDRNLLLHTFSLLSPLDVALFGGDFHLAQFVLQLTNNAFDEVNAEGKIKLPGATGGQGIAFNMEVAANGNDYTLTLTGAPADNSLQFGPVQLNITQFSLSVSGGNFHAASGEGTLLLPGLNQPFNFSFVAAGSPNPTYTITLSQVQAQLSGFEIAFQTFQLISQQPQFTASGAGTLKLPVFTGTGGLDFNVQVAQNNSYSIAVVQNASSIKFGSFGLSQVQLSLVVDAGVLQDFSGAGQLQIPGLGSPIDVNVTFVRQAGPPAEILTISLPLGIPEIPFFGGGIKLDAFSIAIHDHVFNASSANGRFKLPGGATGPGLAYTISIAAGGDDYDILLDGSAPDNALQFGPVSLEVDAFALAVKGGDFFSASGNGTLAIEGVTPNGNPWIFAFSASQDTPPVYIVTIQSVSASLGEFQLQFSEIQIECQAPQFTARAEGTLVIPAFSDGGALAFDIDFGTGSNYDIEVSSNANPIRFGGFEVSDLQFTIAVQAGQVQDFSTSGKLLIPGVQGLLDVNAAYVRSNAAGKEELNFGYAGNATISMAGASLTLLEFALKIEDGSFHSSSGKGTLSLPGSTGGAGIHFTIVVQDGGNTYTVGIDAAAGASVLNFGPVTLTFNSFSLLVVNGSVQSVTGNGSLQLPGFSGPVAFVLDIVAVGPDQVFRIQVTNVNVNLSEFQLHFTHILLESKTPAFTFESAGNLQLPVFQGGAVNFALAVSNNATYDFSIDGTGQQLTMGEIVLSDLALAMQVTAGQIGNASGSGKLQIPGLTQQGAPLNIAVGYSDNGINRDFSFATGSNAPLSFAVFTLTISTLNFLIRNGSLQIFNIQGSASMPQFTNGGNLTFAFSYNHGTQQYQIVLQSTGTFTLGGLELKDVAITATKAFQQNLNFTGTASFKIPGAESFTVVSVTYLGNKLSFAAQLLPVISVGGFSFQFTKFGFGIESSLLTDLLFTGTVTLPLFQAPNNQLGFSFNLSPANSSYIIQINPSGNETELKIGDVSLFVGSFSLTIANGVVQSISGNAGLQFAGFENTAGNAPARFNVAFSYQAAGQQYQLTLSGNNQPAKIGGFEFTLETLTLAFTAGSLTYPFAFAGKLKIPGLTDDSGQPAELGVTFNVPNANSFTGSVSTNAVFKIGTVEVSFSQSQPPTITKNGSVVSIKLAAKLKLTGIGGGGQELLVDIEIDSQGNFKVKGTAEPALKVVDIPAAVRIYLSMIELSRKNNNWDFALAGMIQNQIVIPGMDNLLPNEINLRNLTVANNFGLDLDIKWPSGLKVTLGNTGGDITIPVNGKFGNAITLDALKLSYVTQNGNAEITVAFVGATIQLGPIVAVIDGVGVIAKLERRNPPATSGNFGVVNITMEFKPPNGLGVSLDTPVFYGGGYLFFDELKGEYAGAVELSFKGIFAITAIGIINNKMPDGKPGTSVLFIMSVQFTPGIALGFGFFLSGLGGIIGIHRTVQTEKLREGVRNGSIANILFPKNIIANISRIISDIKDIFPVKRDQFVIGPMAAITWGIPTILRIDLGLAIEFANPVRFYILGVLRVILPDEKVALIKIQVAFLGMIDFEKQMLSFDASLFDSKILTFGLEGDMVLRLSWGQKKDFVLSVGGFHPRFNPPTYLEIPKMRRLTIKILSGNPRLTLTSYFAVTTNTVQFGAGIDFYFSISGFKIVGEFGFDVLFQFSPFMFIADAHARLAVKAGSTTLFSISLEFSLEGPTPWRARGTAKFKVLFITIKARFDETWGDRRDTTLPNIAVYPLLRDALQDNQNWRSVVKSSQVSGMRMLAVDATTELILTPNGSIELVQKIVPLHVAIQKFGQYKPSDYDKFDIKQVTIGGTVANHTYVQDVFAPANFLDVNDKDKLALPSFEQQDAGISVLGNTAMKTGMVVNRDVTYEQSIMDKVVGVTRLDLFANFMQKENTFFMRKGAVGMSALSANKNVILNTKKVTVNEPMYAAVNTDNLSSVGASGAGFMQAIESIGLGNVNVQIIPQDILM
jgi:hypothetical protein